MSHKVAFWWSFQTIEEALRAYLEQAPHWQARDVRFRWHEDGVDITAIIPDSAMSHHDVAEFEAVEPVAGG